MGQKFQVIRGQRILNQLNEMTYAELERNTMAFQPQSKQRQFAVNPIQIANVELIPHDQSGGLEARGTANSTGNQYRPQMLFSEVVFEEEDTAENVTFEGPDGTEFHIRPISLSNNNIKVRCTCLDFRWRFAIWNDKADALYGPGPGVYRRTTDRAPVNPQQVPGLCKHLLAMTIEIKQMGLVR